MSKNLEKQLAKSPDRHSFQAKSAIEVLKINPNNEDALAKLKMFDEYKLANLEIEADPTWQKDNMEYDLRTASWICDKVKEDNVYAQHLYAAMCNRDFMKLEMLPILKDQKWSCSWRHAGGIIADMREEGDYIDWYCSGIRSDDLLIDEEIAALSPEHLIRYKESLASVGEGVVTDEIKSDLQKLGWAVLHD